MESERMTFASTYDTVLGFGRNSTLVDRRPGNWRHRTTAAYGCCGQALTRFTGHPCTRPGRRSTSVGREDSRGRGKNRDWLQSAVWAQKKDTGLHIAVPAPRKERSLIYTDELPDGSRNPNPGKFRYKVVALCRGLGFGYTMSIRRGLAAGTLGSRSVSSPSLSSAVIPASSTSAGRRTARLTGPIRRSR